MNLVVFKYELLCKKASLKKIHKTFLDKLLILKEWTLTGPSLSLGKLIS